MAEQRGSGAGGKSTPQGRSGKTRDAGGPISKGKALINGASELPNVIFDCDGKGTDFQKCLEQIGTHVGGKMEYGGDMNISVRNQKMVFIKAPDRPTALVADEFDIAEWKVEFQDYVRHRKKVEAQLQMIYSIVWNQCTERMKAKLIGQKDVRNLESSQDSIGLLKII